jgi:hypothetical protein
MLLSLLVSKEKASWNWHEPVWLLTLSAEEQSKNEKQIPHPAKTAHRVLRSGQAGIRDDIDVGD